MGRADAHAVEHDDCRAPHQALGMVCTNRKRSAGDRLIQQLLFIGIETARGLFGQHPQRVDQGLRQPCADLPIPSAPGGSCPTECSFGLLSQAQNERGEMRVHGDLP